MLPDVLQGLDEQGRSLFQFIRVIGCQAVKEAMAFRRHFENRAPLVAGIRGARQQPFALRPIDQLNSAVVLQAKPLGRVRDGDRLAVACAGDLQEELMLLGLEAGFERDAFAEVDKAAELIAKFCQAPKQRARAGLSTRVRHIYIVSRYFFGVEFECAVFSLLAGRRTRQPAGGRAMSRREDSLTPAGERAGHMPGCVTELARGTRSM